MWKRKTSLLFASAVAFCSLVSICFIYFYYEEEKYLAYLPHSGLSNQRIELANALLLAAILKRTLIIPPAFLGNVMGWMPREQLLDHLGWLTTPKDFETICQPPTPGDLPSYIQRSKCAEYQQFAAIPWTHLHDFSALSPYVRIRFQDTVSLEKLQQDLGITDKDTFIYEDAHLYDWRLYEDIEEAKQILRNGSNYINSFTDRKYYKIFTLEHWKNRPERLLQLGGIFGSTRLNMVKPEHVELQQRIAEALRYRLDTPLGETVKGIVEHLGGKATFMAVHFRVRDVPFRTYAIDNLHAFERNMSIATGIPVPPAPPLNEFGVYTSLPKPPPRPKNVIRVDPPTDLRDVPWSNLCEHVSPNLTEPIDHVGSHAIVYIATDHKDLRGENSRLLEWFDYFPCTLTLNDIPSELLNPLDQMHCMFSPSKPLKSFLIPLVDAMVAAHARRIFTTPRSTFSKYIGELNEAWVLKEQGYTLDSFS
ncbi:hypothetical protein BCV72DRAFT_233994 [Rhizopus microsporus var. microsporus]|uniref:CigA protein n=3 Tax=Rhizopus TaxID=4842 RepID=A0A2G4T2Z1_RHIZD|nr:uncharacterized protein RHIMIDRAFT_272302 [Rhizopus microsporus ATCC 52813]ORE02849.1 hypothetical protein BCV72DRAFT_233994 [Rhizopus microsporus var. microsporus]PHZ15379.1 hypothetical protein RHIMIDRAFT_272302 [Rhizopus microsporus ATCC 52813]